MSKSEVKSLEGLLEHRKLEPGEVLQRQGDEAAEVFVVHAGALEVVKSEPGRDKEHRIDEVKAGEVVGEAALFDAVPCNATVRALQASEVYALPWAKLRERAAREGDRSTVELYQRLGINLAEALARRLRAQSDEVLEGAKQREAMGEFIVNVLLLMCLYVFLLSGLSNLGGKLPASTSYVSIPLQIVFGVGSWLFIRRSGYPLHQFGIGLRHMLGSLLEAVLFTVPVLALLIGIKWVLLLAYGSLGTLPLIEYPDVMARLRSADVLPLFAIYVLASAVQELIVRGALQSSLQMFLSGRRRVLKAIVVSALLFSVTHLHMSFLFATLAFVPGLFWGWLYARRPNLIGPTISHIAVGAFVFFIMGVNV